MAQAAAAKGELGKVREQIEKAEKNASQKMARWRALARVVGRIALSQGRAAVFVDARERHKQAMERLSAEIEELEVRHRNAVRRILRANQKTLDGNETIARAGIHVTEAEEAVAMGKEWRSDASSIALMRRAWMETERQRLREEDEAAIRKLRGQLQYMETQNWDLEQMLAVELQHRDAANERFAQAQKELQESRAAAAGLGELRIRAEIMEKEGTNLSMQVKAVEVEEQRCLDQIRKLTERKEKRRNAPLLLDAAQRSLAAAEHEHMLLDATLMRRRAQMEAAEDRIRSRIPFEKTIGQLKEQVQSWKVPLKVNQRNVISALLGQLDVLAEEGTEAVWHAMAARLTGPCASPGGGPLSPSNSDFGSGSPQSGMMSSTAAADGLAGCQSPTGARSPLSSPGRRVTLPPELALAFGETPKPRAEDKPPRQRCYCGRCGGGPYVHPQLACQECAEPLFYVTADNIKAWQQQCVHWLRMREQPDYGRKDNGALDRTLQQARELAVSLAAAAPAAAGDPAPWPKGSSLPAPISSISVEVPVISPSTWATPASPYAESLLSTPLQPPAPAQISGDVAPRIRCGGEWEEGERRRQRAAPLRAARAVMRSLPPRPHSAPIGRRRLLRDRTARHMSILRRELAWAS